jgi:hypothetical protein
VEVRENIIEIREIRRGAGRRRGQVLQSNNFMSASRFFLVSGSLSHEGQVLRSRISDTVILVSFCGTGEYSIDAEPRNPTTIRKTTPICD